MGYKQLSVVFFVFLYQLVFSSSMCTEDQSISLLKFQKSLTIDPSFDICDRYGQQSYPKTSSWNMNRDCCLWDGVICDKMSGHMIELDLSCSQLVGKIDSNSSLFQLSHLQRLNLSRNDFSNSYISPEFGRFSSLTHLDLSYSYFSGQIPSEISHLSKLQWLSLSYNFLRLGPHNFEMLLQNLTRLRELDLTFVDISSTIPPNISSHVTTLRLGHAGLYGKIDSNSCLFQLFHLQRLDLSRNDFSGSHISPEFGRFSNLTHLDLSDSYFSGQIPSEISHLSKLQSLSFSRNMLRLGPHHFKMLIQTLAQLRELDLSEVSISSTIPLNFSSHLTTLRLDSTGLYGVLPDHILHLPNLKELFLSMNNQLNGYFPKTKWNSSASLTQLDLSDMNFSSNLPESLGYLTSLHYLSLQRCNLRGPIPELNLTRIESLFLGGNSLNGTIPSWMFSLPSLCEIDLSDNHFSGQLENFKSISLKTILLSDNQLQGNLPKSIQNLVNLTDIDLSSNNFSGNVDVSIFAELKHLFLLDLSYNSISLINEKELEFNLPEFLDILRLATCEVKELEFLRSAKQLEELDLSNNKIKGRIPDWAWSNWMFSMRRLNLSHNMLESVDSIPLQSLETIDLRSNNLQGPLPIPPNSTTIFFISHNNLSGEIPLSICDLTSLWILDLARNNLCGEIPQCLGNLSLLEVLDMHHNNFSGILPTTFSIGSLLRSVNLHENELQGEIPRSLVNCKELQVLDLGDNHLTDTFPMWLATLPKLQVLSLRLNKLHGPIGTSKIENMFPKLRIIDLSYNAFSGNLPTSLFQHLKAMRTIDQSMKAPKYLGDLFYQDSVTVATKGLELELFKILIIYTTIDLSGNKFEGGIPSIMGDLIALRVLSLSHNKLQGHIPPSLGSLSLVESLDLSFNQLSGEIPQQLASLNSLEFLNLSHNHLQGCIPQGYQFSTFEKYSYVGNDGLRGFPVSKGCGNDLTTETNYTVSALDDQESNSEFLSDFWKAALMGYGSGLCIGLSIVYFMMSTGNMKWLATIIEELEHKIIMRRRKKQQSQRRYRRRNNHI